jgi:hypothetical protein
VSRRDIAHITLRLSYSSLSRAMPPIPIAFAAARDNRMNCTTYISERRFSYRARIQGTSHQAIGNANKKLATTTVGIKTAAWSDHDLIVRMGMRPTPNRTAFVIPKISHERRVRVFIFHRISLKNTVH